MQNKTLEQLEAEILAPSQRLIEDIKKNTRRYHAFRYRW